MKSYKASDFKELERVPALTWVLALLLASFGLLLLATSLILPETWNLRRELTKELGIVILAVFGVSLIYELLLAKRYSERFLAVLRREVEKGESNAAVCALLGIRRIFATRDRFEKEYSLPDIVPFLRDGAQLQVCWPKFTAAFGQVRGNPTGHCAGCPRRTLYAFSPRISIQDWETFGS